jgi:hypothetical protein
MKKILTILAFLILSKIALADVIYFPYEYSLISYSLEVTYSLEKITKPSWSTVLWGGAGLVGSIFYWNHPTMGLEIAAEKRYYFKPELFRHFFLSGYLGTAFMTEFKFIADLGIVPGIKMNYKAQLNEKAVLEPYISLSLPVTYDLTSSSMYVPFPVVTVGIRFGICNLTRKIRDDLGP